ncbi:hypothetical protein KQI91_13270 [Blautia sp. MSJ-19]|nr:hypothetical protein [Blautia sp. MSJ-19]MBU5482164.1 hypothetical protein [Blautia sp. MSJ-19]
MEVVDSIDWRRVKNVRTLCVVGEIYAANKRYEDSREIFLLAYHRAPIGKNILYRLIEISLKMKDISEAEEFYEEFLEIAPNDNTQYILKYKICKEKQVPLEDQIKILEEYKEKEFTERWSYELAKLYYQNGETEKCLDLCNEMVIWFSDGKYVIKALDLKNRMGMLTGAEKEKYEKEFVPNLTPLEEADSVDTENKEKEVEATPVAEEDGPAIDSVMIDERDVNSAESLQEKISKGIRDIFSGKKKDEKEEFSEEKDETEAEVQEEMIKDSSSDSEKEDVPDLEPEDAVIHEPKRPGESIFNADRMEEKIEEVTEEEIKEEEDQAAETEVQTEDKTAEEVSEDTTEESVEAVTEPEETVSEEVEPTVEAEPAAEENAIKMPKLEIPDSLKNINLDETGKIEIPKAPNIILPGMEEPDMSDFDFNLEDTILAAATAQGIEIPKDPIPAPKREELPAEDDGEEYMSEEDLQSAEDEFLNGPADKTVRDDEPEDAVDDFAEEAGYEDEDEDDFLKGMDFFEEAPQKMETIRIPVEEIKETRANQKSRKPLSEEEELEQLIDSMQPDAGEDIIPRDKEMTEEEEKLFTYFAKVPGLKEQIVDALCDVQLCAADRTSKTGNVIVMGGNETGKTRLISGLIPAICKELNLEASKVAYVFADQINGKNIKEIVKKMSGGFLVIENANQLTKETVSQLNKAMEDRTDGMIVIIEDEKIGMRKLIARFPKFTSKFTSMINIPVFTNDELVNFAKVYTRENGYTIDQMGMLALYNLISTSQKEDQPMNVGAVKEIVDNAIAKSNGGLRKLISKKKVNPDGYMVLYEKDFS